MAILGTTHMGDGRYRHTLDHDPSAVATIGRKGSLSHDISTDDIWLKIDDGETTNWINIRDAANVIASGTYQNILQGITNVGEALDALDNLNFTQIGGGIVGGCVITQHNQSQPYSEVTTTSWTALAAMAYEGSSTYPITTMWSVVSLSSTGEGEMRVYDVTNQNTISTANWTNPTQHIEIDSVANLPTNNAVFEIQLRKVTGGKPRMWSMQLK
jgi:hypothetical protein